MTSEEAKHAAPSGFVYRVRKSGDVVVSYHGREAAVLRGTAAASFLSQIARCGEEEAQQLMARLTGNYKRGNEGHAKMHRRNHPTGQ